MLARHGQLLDLLELTQVMENCVRSQSYDEALRLWQHVQRSSCRHPDIALLRSLSTDAERVKQSLLQQLLRDLRSNVQLSQCLRIVSLLRKMDVFTETEIRMKFLMVSC